RHDRGVDGPGGGGLGLRTPRRPAGTGCRGLATPPRPPPPLLRLPAPGPLRRRRRLCRALRPGRSVPAVNGNVDTAPPPEEPLRPAGVDGAERAVLGRAVLRLGRRHLAVAPARSPAPGPGPARPGLRVSLLAATCPGSCPCSPPRRWGRPGQGGAPCR